MNAPLLGLALMVLLGPSDDRPRMSVLFTEDEVCDKRRYRDAPSQWALAAEADQELEQGPGHDLPRGLPRVQARRSSREDPGSPLSFDRRMRRR